MVESTDEIEPIWSPYVMMAPPFKTIWWKKWRNSPKTIPFKTINPVRQNPCLLRMAQAIWTPDPCCLMNLTYIKHPQHHPHHHSWCATHPDHHHAHPQHHFHPEIIHGAQLRGLLTQRQEETPVWTSFHQTPWHWHRTHTWTFSPVSWNFTISTLQNTVAGQGQGPREN